jgi:hypothetical protein
VQLVFEILWSCGRGDNKLIKYGFIFCHLELAPAELAAGLKRHEKNEKLFNIHFTFVYLPIHLTAQRKQKSAPFQAA